MSKILLDYFFKVSSIEPVPAASTSFLRQVAVVVKKKVGATNGVYQLTASSQIATYTDNTEAAQLFNAGMNKVFLIVSDDLDLDDELAAQAGQFYTLIVSSDFTKTNFDGADFGAFDGVIGFSSSTESEVADVSAESKRVGFFGNGTNKAKNMMYAFGKLLSQTSWKNLQYITMPLDDGVNLLGSAETMFDDKVSFVISDDEYGKRLALFAAGGKAIVAPYITKNIVIDLQSTALQYVSGNQPAYTKKEAALLEDEMKKMVQQKYIDTGLIEDAVIEVKLIENNFVANGYINIAEPKALWRIFADMQQTL